MKVELFDIALVAAGTNNCRCSNCLSTALCVVAAIGLHRLWRLWRLIHSRVLFDTCSEITEAVSKQSRTSIEQGTCMRTATGWVYCNRME